MTYDEEARIRRLALMRRRPALSSKTDDFLLLCVEEATDFFMDYTNRTVDPGPDADRLICEIATLKANAEGAENVSSASDGGISRSWYGEIPPLWRNRLNNWRLIRGLQRATDGE